VPDDEIARLVSERMKTFTPEALCAKYCHRCKRAIAFAETTSFKTCAACETHYDICSTCPETKTCPPCLDATPCNRAASASGW